MPDLDLVPVPLYQALQPYHWEYDNLPLQNLITRDQLINYAVDNNTHLIRAAIGTQGTLANRLAQSIEDDGSLKAAAVDDILHSIGAHTDGNWDGEDYVRMLLSERAKLDLIADEATNFSVQVETLSGTILFDDGPIILEASDTVSWQVTSPNIVKANLGFPSAAAHRHFYNVEPVTEDFKNYTVTTLSTPYVEGSLRVHVNGARVDPNTAIYVPGPSVNDDWVLLTFTPDAAGGAFVLSQTLTEDDVVRIDFDISLT